MNNFYNAKELKRRSEWAIKTKYKKPTCVPVDLYHLTQYRIEEALLKAALRGHFNVSLMFYQKYYFEEDLKAILDAELNIYKNKGYRIKTEKKESPTQGIYYKVRIEW